MARSRSGAPGGRGVGAPLDLSTLAAPNDPPGAGAPGMGAPGMGAPGVGRAARATASPRSRAIRAPADRSPRCRRPTARRTTTTSPTATSCVRTMRSPKTDSAVSFVGIRATRMAPEAQYWLGESLFQRQRYPATPPRPSSTSRPSSSRPRRRPTPCCDSGSRSRRSARRKPPVRRSARSCASIRAHRSA